MKGGDEVDLSKQELIDKVKADLESCGAEVIIIADVDDGGKVDYSLKAKFVDGTI